MTSPFATPSTSRMDRLDQEALKHAAGGRDLLDYLAELERRIERLEAQVNTH